MSDRHAGHADNEIDAHRQPEVDAELAAGAGNGDSPPTADPAARPWLPSPPQVNRYKDAAAIAEAAARRFLDSAKRAVAKRDRFIVVLAGGATPRALYRLLAESPYREKVPWGKTLFVFGDERCVPPDDEASNYGMVHDALLAPLEIPEYRVLRMKGEQTPTEAARRYEVRLGDLFLNLPKRRFDLVLLGIGADGHTASLFPGTAALDEQERWVVANHVPQIDAWRLTLTFRALNSARRVIFLGTGEKKAQVIAEAFGGVEHAEPHPCERVAPLHARREVLIDPAAASRMPEGDGAGERPDAVGDGGAGSDGPHPVAPPAPGTKIRRKSCRS
jgi:6-phosphogluconolactonase